MVLLLESPFSVSIAHGRGLEVGGESVAGCHGEVEKEVKGLCSLQACLCQSILIQSQAN